MLLRSPLRFGVNRGGKVNYNLPCLLIIFLLTKWQQENRRFLIICRTRARNLPRSLLRYLLLSRDRILHLQSLPLPQKLLLHQHQLLPQHRPGPKQPNRHGRRKIAKVKTRLQRRLRRKTWQRNRKRFQHPNLRNPNLRLLGKLGLMRPSTTW